jgi:hypothetical protein
LLYCPTSSLFLLVIHEWTLGGTLKTKAVKAPPTPTHRGNAGLVSSWFPQNGVGKVPLVDEPFQEGVQVVPPRWGEIDRATAMELAES